MLKRLNFHCFKYLCIEYCVLTYYLLFLTLYKNLFMLTVMLVDDSIERRQRTLSTLNSIGCDVIANLASDKLLIPEIEYYQPDIVIIDMDLPDRDTLENLRVIQSNTPKPMVMFSQDDNGKTIRRAVEAGVSAYVVDGINQNQVRPILDAAIASFDQFHQLKDKLKSTQTELANRKIIDKAKGLLMKQRKVDESTAYHLMRKSAMNQKKSLVEIAQQLISAAELFGASN